MAEDTYAKVVEILCKETGHTTPSVTSSSNLEKDLDLDEVDLVSVTLDIEDEFDIEISDGQMYGFKTVQDIIDCVNEALA